MPKYGAKWEKVLKECALHLVKGYANGVSVQDQMVSAVNFWSTTLQQTNPKFTQQDFGGKSFGQLSLQEKLDLSSKINRPDLSLQEFCLFARQLAAVGQKVL